MAIPLFMCLSPLMPYFLPLLTVSFTLFLRFRCQLFFPFCPQPAPLTLPISFSFLLHLPLALPLSHGEQYISQSCSEPCSASCHGNSITASTPSLPPPFLLFFSSCPPSLFPALSPPVSLSFKRGGGALNRKWAAWPIGDQSVKVNRWLDRDADPRHCLSKTHYSTLIWFTYVVCKADESESSCIICSARMCYLAPSHLNRFSPGLMHAWPITTIYLMGRD